MIDKWKCFDTVLLAQLFVEAKAVSFTRVVAIGIALLHAAGYQGLREYQHDGRRSAGHPAWMHTCDDALDSADVHDADAAPGSLPYCLPSGAGRLA